MITWMRTASAALVALFVLTGCGIAPTNVASSALDAAQPRASVGRQIGQQAAAAARRAAMTQADGTVRLSFRAHPPIVVRSSLEIVTTEVNARAIRMMRRHVDDLSLEQATLVVKAGCLFKFAKEFYGEEDASDRAYMLIQEYGGIAMLVPRAIALGKDMDKAANTYDMMDVAAVGAACEAVGFVKR